MIAARRSLRGWVLLEMLLALTIFVFTAIAVLGAVNQAIAGAQRTRDRSQAVDLARSTLSKLEAGLGTVQNLSGPVPAWEPTVGEGRLDGSGAGFSDTAPPPSPWEVEIDTLPSNYPGLTHVTVTAVKRPSPESERVEASFTLHQLVRLGPELEASGALGTTGAPGAPSAPESGEGGR